MSISEKRAIIDIGSNTVRLVIYNGPPRAPVVLLNEKVIARLGRDVEKTGLLSEKAMELALSALRRYFALLKLSGVTDVQAVATAAARDADNGPAFLAEIAALGLKPRLLSGEEEAQGSAMGVIAAFPGAHGIAGDLGGGSLELTRIAGNACHEGITLPLGTLRLPDMRRRGDEAFEDAVRKMLVAKGWTFGRGEPFYLVGGSWRALALYAMHLSDWPIDDPHDFELSARVAAKICASLAKDGPVETASRISSSRLETLPEAAALLGTLITVIKPSRIVFSSWGLREGLLYTALPAEQQEHDPLCASVAAFVERYDVSARGAAQVVEWIGDTVPAAQPVPYSLRHAATMLSLAVMRTEPNVRAGEALDWALRKRWIGLSARGRAMIATAVLANTGRTVIDESMRRFANEDDLEWAVRWGLAVRLARKMFNCSAAALNDASLAAEDNRLVLTLGDLTAPLYNASAAKNLNRLGERLGLEADTRGAEAV